MENAQSSISEQSSTSLGDKKPRLKFIDLARTIAILMMLEGHFVDHTLADRHLYDGHPIYEIWVWIRGITAPLFLTVSGLIFSYLILGDKEPSFFKKKRVTKGLKRAGILLLIGYSIQASIFQIPWYLEGNIGSWVYNFHILQCVAVGLITLIGMMWISHTLKKLPIYVCYIIGIALFLTLRIYLLGLPEGSYYPEGFPSIIQNAFKGPASQFPIAPWLSFVLAGAALGSYLRLQPKSQQSSWWLFAIGGILYSIYFISKPLLISHPNAFHIITWFSSRCGQAIFILAILRWIELHRGIHATNTLKIGQETFVIYILHFIILYGGLFGIGISSFTSKAFLPWQAALGALLFTLFHAAFGIWWSHRKNKA